MNEYDSQKMGDVLGSSHGMVITNDINDADVLIMNTCSIREKAQEKVFSELGRWRKLKEKTQILSLVLVVVLPLKKVIISKSVRHMWIWFWSSNLASPT